MRCPVHLSIGQESIPVAICQNLRLEDQLVTAHRSHAHYLAKGGDLKKMWQQRGDETVLCSGLPLNRQQYRFSSQGASPPNPPAFLLGLLPQRKMLAAPKPAVLDSGQVYDGQVIESQMKQYQFFLKMSHNFSKVSWLCCCRPGSRRSAGFALLHCAGT